MVSYDFERRQQKSRRDATLRERRRVAKLNSAFNDLQGKLPDKLQGSKTKREILQGAVGYIQTLISLLGSTPHCPQPPLPLNYRPTPLPISPAIGGGHCNVPMAAAAVQPSLRHDEGFTEWSSNQQALLARNNATVPSYRPNTMDRIKHSDMTSQDFQHREDDFSEYGEVPPLKDREEELPKTNIYWLE
ncbi:myoblast determination protein 1-like [Ptychodera flava]|uniref:myoblast determination protein 1-like n=1 Tax=Ptychodera flava TaxID=63121 RepID=UPI003969D414